MISLKVAALLSLITVCTSQEEVTTAPEEVITPTPEGFTIQQAEDLLDRIKENFPDAAKCLVKFIWDKTILTSDDNNNDVVEKEEFKKIYDRMKSYDEGLVHQQLGDFETDWEVLDSSPKDGHITECEFETVVLNRDKKDHVWQDVALIGMTELVDRHPQDGILEENELLKVASVLSKCGKFKITDLMGTLGSIAPKAIQEKIMKEIWTCKKYQTPTRSYSGLACFQLGINDNLPSSKVGAIMVPAEYGASKAELGWQARYPSAAQVITKYDTNGDGGINLEEYGKFVKQSGQYVSATYVGYAYKYILESANYDNFVDPEEAREFFGLLGITVHQSSCEAR